MKKLMSYLTNQFKEKNSNIEFSKDDILWLLVLFSQKNKINLDVQSVNDLLQEKNTWQSFTLLTKELDITLGKPIDDELNFIIFENQNQQELAFYKKEENGLDKIILKTGQIIESTVDIKIIKIFSLKKKINYFDFSEQELQSSFGWKWFINQMIEYKSLWINVVLWSLLLQCVSFAMPLMTQTIVDKVIVQQTTQTLIALVIGVFIFNFFNTFFSWSRQQLILYIGTKIDFLLANKVIMHLFRLEHNFFTKRNTGNIISRVHAVESIREFLAGTFITLILDLPFVILFIIVMFYYSILLTAISLSFIAIMILITFIVAPILKNKALQQSRCIGQNQAFLTEYVGSMETVKSLQLEGQLFSKYRGLFDNYLLASKSTRNLAINYNSVMTWIEQFLNLTILGIGAYICMSNNGFTIGMLIAFQMFCSRVTQPMIRISGMWQEFQQMQISMLRLKDIMDEPIENYHYLKTNQLSKIPTIEFKNVGFSYEKNNPIYSNLNLKINPGELMVIQGASGSGKSTLTKLLQGFYHDYEGKIEIDGVDISKMSVQQLRKLMGVVPQESVLFSGTIMDNFKLTAPDSTFEEVVAACKMADIHDVIQNLSNGYETLIGERGAGLSGGQKQRIAIARALLKKPQILIFDEATSNLDQHAGQLIINTINNLKGLVTIIFISHNDVSRIKFDNLHILKK